MPRPRKYVSQRQLAANRANAARSTGPRTPQGKARSAQNGLKHGFTASTFAVVRLETGLFTTCLNQALDPSGNGDIAIARAQNRDYLLGEGFHRMAVQSNSWTLAKRYQARAERHYRSAVEEFDRLKALRPELPKFPEEPIYAPQSEEKETTCTQMTHEPISPPVPSRTGGFACPPRPSRFFRIAGLVRHHQPPQRGSSPHPPVAG
jgi:hypothetical protein